MNPTTVIGREEELATISRLYESERSEFLAIYGRRRLLVYLNPNTKLM